MADQDKNWIDEARDAVLANLGKNWINEAYDAMLANMRLVTAFTETSSDTTPSRQPWSRPFSKMRPTRWTD